MPQIIDALAPGRKLAAERAILGFVYGLRKFNSVVDFGCGLGNWLKVARELGALEVRGYDAPDIPLGARNFASADFVAADLSRFIDVEGHFDVALCLESADRNSAESALPLVKTLCAAADWVLFSAPLPLQEGTIHPGDNWMEYWAGLFLRENFLCYDILRSKIWLDRDIAFNLRQNICLYARKGTVEPLRARGLEPCTRPPSLIHPELFLKIACWLENRRALSTDARVYADELALYYRHAEGIADLGASKSILRPNIAI